jgi:hypothetical protein
MKPQVDLVWLTISVMRANHEQGVPMTTKLDIDPELLITAMQAGGHKTEQAAVSEALIEYIHRRNQAGIVELFGTIPFDEDYDYKEERKRDTRRGS